MKKSLLVLAMLAVMSVSVGVHAQETSTAPVKVTKGKMLYASNGGRLASVYRVEGNRVQFILDGKMRSVPSNTLSMVDGKLTTSLSKSDVIAH